MSNKMNLLLIGYWGNGKSATANTVLGYDAFTKNNSTIAVNTVPAVKSSKDGKITIVDGLCLWGKDPKSLSSDALFDVQTAVEDCGKEGIDAIVIVVRYGEKFSEDEANLIEVAKKVFGPKVLGDFCVCLVTHGDDFKYAVEEGEEQCTTFENWCKKQTGNLGKLFRECGQRCVLFDNKTKDPKQIEDFLTVVRKLSHNGARRYTMNDFRKVHDSEYLFKIKAKGTFQNIRERLKNKPEITDLQKMSQMLLDLSRKVKTEIKDLQQMERLMAEAQTLKNFIESMLEKKSTVNSHDPLGVTMDITSGFRHAVDEQTCDLTIRSEYFDQDASSCRPVNGHQTPNDSQRSAEEAKSLIRKFEKELKVNFFKTNQEVRTGFEKMKCQVLEMVKNTPYFDYYKSLIEKRKHELRQQYKWVTPTEYELPEKTKSVSLTPEVDDDKPNRDKKVTDGSIRLLLLGRSGNGKSSTGNTILGRTAFKVTSSAATVKSAVAQDSEDFKHYRVSVVDGPSLDDAVIGGNTNLDLMIESIKDALQKCDYSFSGLLVVLKFGLRFTKQEKDAIVTIKSILGKDVLRKYGVCVMTHGDDYDSSMDDDERIDFDEWCRQQTGDIAELFQECSYRCVLFNNKTRDEKMKEDQRNKLLSLIRSENKYSEEEFIETEKDFDELSIQCAIPRLEEANSIILSKVREKLHQIEQESPKNSESYKLQLEELLKNTQEYKRNIESLGHHSSTEYILQLVSTLELQINSKLRLCLQRDELRQLDTERQRFYEDFNTPTTTIAETMPQPASGQTNVTDVEVSSGYGSMQLGELSGFVEDIYLRWKKSNNRAEPDLQEKRSILKAIETRLEEVKSISENNDVVNRAVAQLIQMRDEIKHGISSQSRKPTRNPYPGSSMSTVTVEGDFEMLVYPHPENTAYVQTMNPYPPTHNVFDLNQSYQQYNQGHTSHNYHSFSCFPTTNSYKVNYPKTKKTKWETIQSKFKKLCKIFNLFV